MSVGSGLVAKLQMDMACFQLERKVYMRIDLHIFIGRVIFQVDCGFFIHVGENALIQHI
jgi:hypothetical protein